MLPGRPFASEDPCRRTMELDQIKLFEPRIAQTIFHKASKDLGGVTFRKMG